MSEVGGIVHSDAQILIAGILSRYNATLLRHTSNDPPAKCWHMAKATEVILVTNIAMRRHPIYR